MLNRLNKIPIKKILVFSFLLILFAVSTTFSQTKEYFPFYSTDTTNLYNLAVAQRISFQSHFVLPAGATANYKNHYKNIIEKSAAANFSRIKNTAFLDYTINPYLQAIFNEVVQANKELSFTKLILTRSPVENAYALADGTIFFNIGLLANLENESQIAFIICHELAHVKARHMEQSIKESLDALYSKEFKKQYKQLAREEYNQQAKMKAFFGDMYLGQMYHKRSQEKQADSLGYLMLSKTKYNLGDSYTALQVLDKIDEPYASRKLDLAKFFNCSGFNYNFNSKPAKTSSIFDVAASEPALSESSDTLKTHPDCQKRIRFLKELEVSLPINSDKPLFQTNKLESIKKMCRLEIVQSWYDTRNYDYALFNSLQLLLDYPESNYLRSMVMLCLYQLKQHLVSHKFSEVVSAESESHPKNFNHLLQVLTNLNTSDYKSISSCFVQITQPSPVNNEYALAVKYAFAQLQNDTQMGAETRKIYLNNFKEGRFRKSLF